MNMWSTARRASCAIAAAIALAIPTAAGAQTAAPTFTKDIAPILQARCQNCHRPGEMAPMSLRTFQEVRPWVRSIRNKVSKGEMPPWFYLPVHRDADHLGPVRLLRCRSVLVDALLLGVLPVQRLAHLGLDVLVVAHHPTIASEPPGVDLKTTEPPPAA